MRHLASGLLLLLAGGCAGRSGAPDPMGRTTEPDSVESPPYIVWNVTTERGHAEGSSPTEGGEHLWSVAPYSGDVFGVTFELDDLVGLRFEAPRRLVPGVLDVADQRQATLWTLSCPTWNGEARVSSDLPHWGVYLHATCAGDPAQRLEAWLEGWVPE